VKLLSSFAHFACCFSCYDAAVPFGAKERGDHTFHRIVVCTIAALAVAASMSAAQTAPNTTTAAAPPPTASSIANTAATSVSDTVKNGEQKVVTSSDQTVALGKQKAITAKLKVTTLRQRYLGYLSQVPKASRAKYQRIATKSGYQRAIAAIKAALGE
jgi:Ni/Co efflux regulator RcnB